VDSIESLIQRARGALLYEHPKHVVSRFVREGVPVYAAVNAVRAAEVLGLPKSETSEVERGLAYLG
jgi:hypothetical protein